MSEWLHPYDFPPDNEQRVLHLERYRFAAGHVNGNVVANAACSCNYGAKILEKPGRLVVGFDRNRDALARAKLDGNILVIDQDIEHYDFDGFTSLVCLETYEHLVQPWLFLDRLSPTVKEMVLSTPIIPTRHFNEWHLHDFGRDEVLQGLTSRGWKVGADMTQDESFLDKPTYGIWYATR